MKTSILLLTLFFPEVVLGQLKVAWPDLSAIKYVSKRHAVESDINSGAAVFLLKSNGINIGTPIDIEIPQYAIHLDGETGMRSNVVIIQAEEANGQQVVGALNVKTQKFIAGFLNEFELLGTNKPE